MWFGLTRNIGCKSDGLVYRNLLWGKLYSHCLSNLPNNYLIVIQSEINFQRSKYTIRLLNVQVKYSLQL